MIRRNLSPCRKLLEVAPSWTRSEPQGASRELEIHPYTHNHALVAVAGTTDQLEFQKGVAESKTQRVEPG